MPTKDELQAALDAEKAKGVELTAHVDAKDAEIEELTGRIDELTDRLNEPVAASEDGLSLRERLCAIVGVPVVETAEAEALIESGLDVDAWEELTDEEQEDLVLHVLLAKEGGGDEEDVIERVQMLEADLQRVTVQRDEARSARDLAQKRLQDAGTLHGSVDSLPPVV